VGLNHSSEHHHHMYKCIVLGITLEKLNGPGYGTNVHIFILGSCNILSFTNISLSSIEVYPCYAFLDLEIFRQFTMRFVITTPTTCLMRCLWNLVYCEKAYSRSDRFFLLILKFANIRCFILIKCSEQKTRFKKYVIMS
jgi:hypothetical protein